MLRPIFGDKALMGGVAYVGDRDRPAGRDRADRAAAAAGVRRIRRHAARRARKRSCAACKPAASMPSSATTSGARSGRNSCSWSRMSGATTTMRSTIGPIRSNPQTRAFLLDLAREVVAVGRAHGVNLPADYAEQRIPFFDGWPPDMTTSMHHDLQTRQSARSAAGSPAAWSSSAPRSACRRR